MSIGLSVSRARCLPIFYNRRPALAKGRAVFVNRFRRIPADVAADNANYSYFKKIPGNLNWVNKEEVTNETHKCRDIRVSIDS